MKYRITPRALLVTLAALLGLGCGGDPETSRTVSSPADSILGVPGEIALVPGPDSGTAVLPANPYTGDADAVAEGQRLYGWYNCAACHGALGGGGMGPPLRDGRWIYGGDAVSLYRSIMQGRPEGMPGWHGKIPDDQVWRIVAFIEALEGDDFSFDPPLRPPRNRVHPSAIENAGLSPTEP